MPVNLILIGPSHARKDFTSAEETVVGRSLRWQVLKYLCFHGDICDKDTDGTVYKDDYFLG